MFEVILRWTIIPFAWLGWWLIPIMLVMMLMVLSFKKAVEEPIRNICIYCNKNEAKVGFRICEICINTYKGRGNI